jgi:hypothetical protein
MYHPIAMIVRKLCNTRTHGTAQRRALVVCLSGDTLNSSPRIRVDCMAYQTDESHSPAPWYCRGMALYVWVGTLTEAAGRRHQA